MKFSLRFLSVFAILIFTLTACRSSLQEQIIGQWELVDQNLGVTWVFSFKDAGFLTIWIEDVPVDGTYTWLDEDTLQITLTSEGVSQDIIGDVQIEGDQLTVQSETGDIDILIRVK